VWSGVLYPFEEAEEVAVFDTAEAEAGVVTDEVFVLELIYK